MAGLFGLWGGGDRASKPIYSIEHLQNLYNRLQHIKNDDDQNRDPMVEVIRQITEALIWGEQNGHDHNFFDFFCEKNILADFVRVLGLPKVSKTVKVQLLQTLSMLVQNIRRDTSLYYLFSNNYVNQLISTQFDWSDEEILGYYISFLKSLAMRLNGETVKFFFNGRAEQFPLYIEAVRFFGHRDQMVRAAVRTTTLQVYSVHDAAMQRFVLERSSRTYFVHLACHLRELWLQLDRRAALGCSSEQLQEANEQQQDLLMYVADVLGLELEPLSTALAERMLRYALYPSLLGSLLHTSGECQLSPTTTLFVLHQVLDTCGRSKALMEPLTHALLTPRLPAPLLQQCLRTPFPPPTYKATTPDVCGPASDEPMLPASEDATESAEPNPDASVRRRLLAHLEASADACVLLAAGTLHACLRLELLSEPPEPALLMRALERHASLRLVALQALVQLAIDLGTSATRSVASAARQVRTYLQGEGFLDAFAEEWEQHCRARVDVREACCSVRCLLPASSGAAEWALPAAHSERQHTAKAIRSLLTLRRLSGIDSEPYPLHVAEEVAEGYQEGRAFELGRQDRIVCGVVTQEGRHTRYLVLHPFLLLLVQPDLESPGWAVVRTLVPVRQVDSQVDGQDPRLLQLRMRLPRGAACPSEASPSDPSDPQFRPSAEDHRGSSFFLLTLSFEDVKRCHCADLHLRKRRGEVRAQLKRSAEAFIEGLCS